MSGHASAKAGAVIEPSDGAFDVGVNAIGKILV
jgi:hypothetical protein